MEGCFIRKNIVITTRVVYNYFLKLEHGPITLQLMTENF